MQKKQEYILCAAIHFNEGSTPVHLPKNIKEGIVLCGRRHHNIFTQINTFMESSEMKKIPQVQGFMTSLDRFVTREEAAKVALLSGQIESPVRKLISEDLY